MRTTKFRDVFNRVVRQHGRDPRKDVPSDMRDALVDHINERVGSIWAGWRWPEWELTEERAFRQIWDNDQQYYRVNPSDNRADEVFYLGAGYVTGDDELGTGYGYYRVRASSLTDPVIGNVPTNTLYWEAIDPVDAYIAYDQAYRRSIGIVRGIYSGNPRLRSSSSGGLNYMPSANGIDICCSGVPTVFVTHTLPCPEYTMMPWITGKTYVRADVVFDLETGECYQAMTTTTNVVTNTDDWNWVPFLTSWFSYVTYGAFADSMLEFDQGGNTELQAKVMLAQAAETKADDALQAEVDTLVTQGQTLRYNFCKSHSCWRESEQWAPTTLVRIT